nr:zinc finger, CCHC-type, retrotransposon Gag domain protein [Tanacetum cinerariifolium]
SSLRRGALKLWYQSQLADIASPDSRRDSLRHCFPRFAQRLQTLLPQIHTWLERFNKQKPHCFEKATALMDAENWISHMQKIFDVMGCEDAFKTILAVYKFEGNALALWKAYKQAKGGDASAGTEEEQAKNFQWGLRRGQQSNRSTNSGSQQSRGPSEGYSYPVFTTCGRRHLGECRRAAGTCFKCGQAGH